MRSPMPRWIVALSLIVGLVVLSSSIEVRALLLRPLAVHDPQARGDACYVLSGGTAMHERLDAAADLFQMGRVSRIYLQRDDARSAFNFRDRRSWTRAQWNADYLAWRGVPLGVLYWVEREQGHFGTWNEARALDKSLPGAVRTLVLVSSAPHMRRSLLAFRRSLRHGVSLVPYAATGIRQSQELYFPIWREYLKLLVYSLIV
jgi:uncharacterized SAM-binding protein YcdF (DUF218 family)